MLYNNQLDLPNSIRALRQLKENWQWYLILGISLVILGTLALIYSVTSTLFSVMYIGIALAMIGIFEIIKSFKINQWSGFFLHIFLGILYIVGGSFIVLDPAINALTLTLLLAIFFIISGILKIVFSFISNTPHKGLLVFNGILTLILGIIIWKQWPVSGLWVIGTLVGIDAIFTGWTWILLSLRAKSLKTID